MTVQHSLILSEHSTFITIDQLSRWLATVLRTELTVLSQHDYLRNTLDNFTSQRC